jgi:hypothetical protein
MGSVTVFPPPRTAYLDVSPYAMSGSQPHPCENLR